MPYREGWAPEFTALGGRLRSLLGSAALRIDHIGSTAVPGLPAKDILDVQITVVDLSDSALDELDLARFRRLSIVDDHRPPGTDVPDRELEKRMFNALRDERAANIHVRAEGRFNQRYPLLCRDYLRTHPSAARAYADVKTSLARIVESDIEAYYDVKDPVFDIIMAGATEWAQATRWKPGPSDA